MPTENRETIPILIVGAGPTGLVTAIELARRNIPIRLIDVGRSSEDKLRAVGVQARTLEMFDNWGLADQFVSRGKQVIAANVFDDKRKLVRLTFSELDSRYPYVLTIPQSETEQILIDYLDRLGGSVEQNVRLASLTQNVAQVTAKLVRGEAAEETIETPWLIGCDGPHSTVRHELNQPFIGEEYPESFLLANVKLLWLLKDDESYDFVHEGRVLKVLPLPEGNYRLIADATDDQVNGDSNLTITDWQTIVDEHVPQRAKVTVLSWSGRYRIHRKLVSGLREGRVFLVGDAAHIHSPTGAQGMNTGIQDAFNLSWKLALVAGGFADESLLDSYHSERYPIEKSVLAASDLPLHVLGITNPIGKAVRDTFMPLISGLELVQQKARNFVSELSVQYSDSSIVEDVSFGGEPSAGERAPNVMVQNIDNSLRPLFSLTRQPGFTALLFDPVGRPFSTAHTYSQITSILQRRLKDNAAIYRITSGAGGSINIADIKVIVDTSDVAAQRYQARHGAFYLIRPDGYISFRSSLETAASRLEPHLDRLLGP